MHAFDDTELVAFLDGKLDAEASKSLEARLLVDADLRERLHRLQAGGLDFKSAFEGLLTTAPKDHLDAALQRALAANDTAPTLGRRRFAMPFAALAAALAMLGLGFVLGQEFVNRDVQKTMQATVSARGDDWRSAVADYAALYTQDTFSSKQDVAFQAEQLARAGEKLGLPLPLSRTEIGNLSFRDAAVFAYDGAELVQLAYVDSAKQPLLFCIIADGEPDAPLRQEQRGGLASASWALKGRGFMVIGHLAEAQIATISRELMARFTM